MPNAFAHLIRTCTFIAGLTVLPPLAHSASSVLIWPIDPVLESEQRASALWLENRGDQPSLLQIRIFGWSQKDYQDLYSEQQEVIGSPPMARIEPGQKQLVRLTRLRTPDAGSEHAYRIILDEIPLPEAMAQSAEDSKAVKFQMRYSVPLFSYGQGLWLKPDAKLKRAPDSAGQPQLRWRVVSSSGRQFLEIGNNGPVHARLTEAAFIRPGQSTVISDGLLGYVLAHSVMRWPLPNAVPAGSDLRITINGAKSATTLSASQ